jgi:hypothetical protein
VDDIISHGPERETGRLARYAPAALMLAMLIAVTAIAIGHLPQHRAAGPRHPSPAAASGQVQLAGLGPGAARMLNGDHPFHMPHSPGDHSRQCRRPLPSCRPGRRPG